MSHEGMIIDFQHDDINQPRPWPVGVKADNITTSGLGHDDGATLIGFARQGEEALAWNVDEARDIDFTVENVVPIFANHTGMFNWDIPIRAIRFIETIKMPEPAPAPAVITDMHFVLDIRLSNAAMQTGEDIARALREIADRLDNDTYYGEWDALTPMGQGNVTDIIVLDTNGKRVGTWDIKEIAR